MIDSYSFGRIVVNGKTYQNDIKIIDQAVIPEWWRKKGHKVLPEDVADLVGCRPKFVVIGNGASGMMKISAAVKHIFRDEGITLLEEKTAKAVHTFNRLQREGQRVCAGFHLTC
jgi:hypothetical protein